MKRWARLLGLPLMLAAAHDDAGVASRIVRDIDLAVLLR
jgi:hypothetical protein